MKKNLKIIIVLLLVLVVPFVFILFKSNNEKITFYLIGNQQVFIGVGEEYHDLGFVAINSKNEDLSKFVQTKSYINNNQIGTYVIKHTLIYNEFTKEISRLVRVVENVNDKYHMVLNGEKEKKHLLGEEYIDEGCLLYDNEANPINVNINVSGIVDTDQIGNYQLVYSAVYDGNNYEIVRNIEIYDFQVDYIITNNDNAKRITFYVDERFFRNVVFPDGTVGDYNTFSFNVYTNGIHSFEIWDIYGNKKNIEIAISDIISDLKCIGVTNRYGTELKVEGKDKDKFSKFEWHIDGMKIIGKNNYKSLYHKVLSASVNVKSDIRNIDLVCNIENNLEYEFKYDVNNQKPFINCNTYTKSDKIILEEKLRNVIMDGGYGTRAGVVEAARFLVGGLDYKIPYLGPKTFNSSLGRYKQFGLNIADDDGWGCSVDGWIQGMDCTNFVEWAFYQAGVKLNDVYGFNNTFQTNDVVGSIRVGDLMLTPTENGFSHVGIIIGIDDENIYIAEATTGTINAIVTTKISKENVPKKGKFSIVKLYKYEQEGNVTNMWVS